MRNALPAPAPSPASAPAAAKREKAAAKRLPLKKSDATRQRILDAAAYVFQSKGYALTRLTDIAKRAKTQVGSIYYYFPSREAIVDEVLRIANERTESFVLGRIAELPADACVEAKIEAAIHGHFAIVLSGDHYASAHMRIFDQTPKRVREHYLRVLDKNAQVWRDLFAEARTEGVLREDVDLSVMRLLLLGMMNWSIEWYKPGRLPVEEIANQAATLFLDGVKKRA